MATATEQSLVKVYLYDHSGEIICCRVSLDLFEYIEMIEKRVDDFGYGITDAYEQFRVRETLLAAIDSEELEEAECYDELKTLLEKLGYPQIGYCYNIDDHKSWIVHAVVPLRSLHDLLFERLR